MKRKLGILGLAVALPLALSACVGGSDDSSGSSAADGGSANQGSGTGEIQYWLWDSAQLPMYQACADAFHAANPDVTVKIFTIA